MSPFMAFASLTDALSRLTALLVMIDDNPEINGVLAADKYITQAVTAHATLVSAGGVIDEIGAFLIATHGGQPG